MLVEFKDGTSITFYCRSGVCNGEKQANIFVNTLKGVLGNKAIQKKGIVATNGQLTPNFVNSFVSALETNILDAEKFEDISSSGLLGVDAIGFMGVMLEDLNLEVSYEAELTSSQIKGIQSDIMALSAVGMNVGYNSATGVSSWTSNGVRYTHADNDGQAGSGDTYASNAEGKVADTDSDDDGVADTEDTDSDNDGENDTDDNDDDNDGISDDEDDDDDNDGIPDKDEIAPWTEGPMIISEIMESLAVEMSTDEFASLINQFMLGTMTESELQTKATAQLNPVLATSIKGFV